MQHKAQLFAVQMRLAQTVVYSPLTSNIKHEYHSVDAASYTYVCDTYKQQQAFWFPTAYNCATEVIHYAMWNHFARKLLPKDQPYFKVF